jgi:hypothetical protein
MTKRPRWLCAVLAVVLTLTGTLAVFPTPVGAQSQMPTVPEPTPPNLEPTPGDRAGAVAMNAVYAPGKFITCSVGTLATTALLLITFGTAYSAAKNLFNEGCGGPWLLTPEDLSGKNPPRELPTSPRTP